MSRSAPVAFFFLILILLPANLLGDTPPESTEISWKTLRGYNLKTGKMSEMLTKLNGKPIRIPGFMVPLDDMDYESVGRFLLVPDPQACIHVPPPPANQNKTVEQSRSRAVAEMQKRRGQAHG